MTLRDQLKTMLLESIKEYVENTGIDLQADEETRLVGQSASVDSLGLVAILANFEAQINDRFDSDIVLASEKAMSMQRSPFRSVASLIDYAVLLLQEVGITS
jgi:acyl carrier protein